MRFAEVDAVTLDAFGTLVGLADPVPTLREALRERGIERDSGAVAEAFAAEGAYYRPRSLEGRDEESLARLRRECVAVFLDALDADLAPEVFVEQYIDALRFELLPGVSEAVRSLRHRGLALAVVGNWDMALPDHLARLGLGGVPVITSAAIGVAKPSPEPLLSALRALGVAPTRALHIGDDEVDERGARAAGMKFAWAPLPEALRATV
jgi:HAD superfamily hydrolase (TIGR01509 family)